MEWGNLFRKPKKPFTKHNFERSEGFNVVLDLQDICYYFKTNLPKEFWIA